jgi:hypothetical protein
VYFRSNNQRKKKSVPGLITTRSVYLEIVDFDNEEVFAAWERKMRPIAKDLLDRIVWVRSPRPGYHAYYRCEAVAGNQKLAERPYVDSNGTHKKQTLIETKGNGGYCLAPPSPAGCHPSGRRYRFLTGRDFTMIETISSAERDVLLSCARELTEVPLRQPSDHSKKASPRRFAGKYSGPRPGDALNATATWAEILDDHGWECVGDDGNGKCYWRRPGKEHGLSATTNHFGNDLLYVFSSNAGSFESRESYDKFAAFALLNFNGDFHRAATELRKRGQASPAQAFLHRLLAPKNKYATK